MASSIISYFTSLVKSINNIDLVCGEMLQNQNGFGLLINIFKSNPLENKDPNVVLLFLAIIETFKNEYPDVNLAIFNHFCSYIFNNLIQYENQNNIIFPELTENFFLLIRAFVANCLENILRNQKELDELISYIIFGIRNFTPIPYSLQSRGHLFEKIHIPSIQKIFQI